MIGCRHAGPPWGQLIALTELRSLQQMLGDTLDGSVHRSQCDADLPVQSGADGL